MSPMLMHFTNARSRRDTSPPLHHAMPNGVSASSTSMTPTATSLVLRGLCGPRCDAYLEPREVSAVAANAPSFYAAPQRDEFRLRQRTTSPSPRLRGEGRGEGESRQ